MKAVYSFLFLLVLLFSCTNKSEEVISFDDLKQSDTKEDFKTDTTHVKSTGVELEANFILEKGIDSLYGSGEWKNWDTALYVQRFGPKASMTYRFISEKDSLQVFQMDFSDSLKTMNAFYNWLDCFGVNCNSYSIGGKIKQQGRNQLILVNTAQILLVEGAKNYKVDKLINSLQQDKKKQNWNYVLVLNSGKNAEWLTVRSGEINKLKP